MISNVLPLLSRPVKPKVLPVQQTLTLVQLRQDFKIFRQALEEGHAGLYRYTAKSDLDDLFNKTLARIKGSLTGLEFYLRLLPIIALINDGHTSISLSSNQEERLNNRDTLFPFNLRFIGKKAYLFRNYSEKGDLMMGAELISINTHSIKHILHQFLPLIPSDARIETSKYRKLESTTYFGRLFTLVFGESAEFTLRYQYPGENTAHTLSVKGVKGNSVTEIFKRRYPDENKESPLLSLQFKEGIPVMTIRTFADPVLHRKKVSFPAFLQKSFTAISQKQAKALIIDLRNNGGGSDLYGRLLAAYLLDHPFVYYRALETKKNKYEFFRHTNLSMDERTIPEKRTRKNHRGWYDVMGHPNLGEHQPMKPHFSGQVYILINGRSFSASGECTSIIHFHKRAAFVGEECGAGYYGNTSGFMPTLILPNSGLRVRIPLVRYTMAVSGYPADRGILPDFPFQPSIKDLLEHKDSILEYTLSLIKTKGSMTEGF